MSEKLMHAGRLSLRVEGTLWCAYYALPDTMEGAIFLASIQMRFVEDEDRKQAFMDMMREAVGDIIEHTSGVRPIWPDPPHRAPENERSGAA